MSAPVDVLAVLDAVTQVCFGDDDGDYSMADVSEARAAVAELIAADADFDRARDGYNPLYANRDQLDRYSAAESRRAAALARCGGDA